MWRNIILRRAIFDSLFVSEPRRFAARPFMGAVRGIELSVRSVFSALLFLVLTAMASPCLGNPKMGPGMGNDINRIIHANNKSCPLPPGWKITQFNHDDLSITVTLKRGNEDEAIVRLSYPGAPVSGDVAGKTLSFRLEIIKAESAAASKAAQAFFHRIRRNDRVYFFASPNMLRRELLFQALFHRYIVSPFIDRKLIFVIGAALALLVLALNFRDIKEYLIPKRAASLIALAAIVSAGIALRLYVSPSTPIHCNSHGIREVKVYLSMGNDLKEGTAYGSVYPSTMKWILGYLGPEEHNLYLMNQIFGMLAILALFMFAKGLTGSDAAGLLSALFFSISPAQVWISGTEYQIPMYQFTGLSGLAFLCLSLRTRSAVVLWLAAILIAFACSLRILTLLIVPIAIVTAIYIKMPQSKGARDGYARHLALCLAMVASWAVFYYFSIPDMTGKGWSEANPIMTFPGVFFAQRLREGNIIFDPTLTPFIVPLTAAAAYYYSWKKDRRFALFITAAFLIAVPLTFSVIDCRTTAVRYQTQGHWVYYILASSVFAGCGPDFRTKRIQAAVAVAILAVAGAVPGLVMLCKGDEEINEYRFIRETAVKIPRQTVIRLPVDNAAGGRLITDYPGYINNHTVVKGMAQAPKGHDELIYAGLDCYRYGTMRERQKDVLPNGKRKQCVSICDGRLMPLYEKELDARRPRIGYQRRFHLLASSKPVVGFYQCIPYDK